ncbi:MAG: fibrobacter succinogenes major paralogous domain-containing protein [Bacteroidales bacterium]|jgi:uncharacterized protein (TIGR02145 family)
MKKTILFLFALVFIYSCTPLPFPYILLDSLNTFLFMDLRDFKVYKTVTIGGQVWMAENLAYLPSVNDPGDGSEDAGHTDDAYYYVNGYGGEGINENVADAKATTSYQTYGVLYNWTAAQSACPEGWHLPSDDEWKELEMYLGISQEQADSIGERGTDQGGKLKEAGTSHWFNPNTGSTNESGFTALPGDCRHTDGSILDVGSNGYWWSSTKLGTKIAWCRGLEYYNSNVNRTVYKQEFGFSVRCLRDDD